MSQPLGAPTGIGGEQLDRPVQQYFCLADGRTAAVINSDGGCDFLCLPRFDGPLRLAKLLDAQRGGSVGVAALSQGSSAPKWEGASRVIEFSAELGVRIRSGLLDDGSAGSAVVWLAEGPVGTRLRINLSGPGGAAGASWAATAFGAVLGDAGHRDGPGGPLILVSSRPTHAGPAALETELGPEGLVVWLGAPGSGGRLPPRPAMAVAAPVEGVSAARGLLDDSVARDQRWVAQLHRGPALARLAGQAPAWARVAVDRSLLTLRGLQDRETGLLVAAATTSIPQWPASPRAWDYRYAWLRDCADAGIAFCHAGARLEAEAVARGLGHLLGSGPDPLSAVRRLSGAELPPEHVLTHLAGYSGALVRIGNGASRQLQLDTLGEVTRLAGELDRAGGCPPELLQHVPALAHAAELGWSFPDHGIWEVRGARRHYVHSKVMAWSALQTAASLAERGRIAGDPRGWRRQAEAIERSIQGQGRGTDGGLVMSFQEPVSDSALLAAYLVSFIRPGQPGADSTLTRISRDLGRGPLMARHSPERDGIAAPCFPFIFPGLWAVGAEALLGRTGAAERRLRAICGLTGPAGQLSEVADPESGALWGNYPQVQSHAALVDAALLCWSGLSRSPA